MAAPEKDIYACHQVVKQGRVIVKFLRMKDCQQDLSMKKDIQKNTVTDLDLPKYFPGVDLSAPR